MIRLGPPYDGVQVRAFLAEFVEPDQLDDLVDFFANMTGKEFRQLHNEAIWDRANRWIRRR